MTTPTTTVSVQALWDGSKLKAGTDESERAVEDLARSVDTASDAMRRSLQSIDDGVSSTLGSSGSVSRTFDTFESDGVNRMGEAGTEVASEFGSNLAEGISSGDTSATVLDSLTGLGATVASAGGALAFAGVGALIGGALVSGIVNKVKQANQAITDSINSAFSAMEVKARQTNREIQKQYQETLSISALYEKLGGDDGAVGGFQKLKDLAAEFGLEAEDAANLLIGKMTPGARALKQEMQGALKNAEELSTETANGDVYLSRQTTTAGALLRLLEDEREVRRDTNELARSTRDGLADQKVLTDSIARNIERASQGARYLDEYTSRIGGNLGSAVRQAGLLDLALNGVDK